MFHDKYSELMLGLNNLNINSFIVAKDAFPIQKILIQPLKRDIDDNQITFLALRDIFIEESARNQGVFSNILYLLEKTGLPIFIDDVVSSILIDFLSKKGYNRLDYTKNDNSILAYYKLKE